jgi:hypothetical protein
LSADPIRNFLVRFYCISLRPAGKPYPSASMAP